MKDTLKIEINDDNELQNEVQDLLFSLGCRWLNLADGEYCAYRIKSHLYALLDKKIIVDRDVTDYRVINIEELRELAQPKEYLDENFKLQVTNQPEDGWILVPDGAEYFVKGHGSEALFFYKQDGEYMAWKMPQGKNWIPSSHTSPTTAFIILWQRENKVEAVKGRFLHQEWYEAFGRGEDVLYSPIGLNNWYDLYTNNELDIFDNSNLTFRLKPETMQIGSRTITKPISVKPEKNTKYYIPNLGKKTKYDTIEWTDHDVDNLFLERGLIHLTKDDAINHTDALLELMK